jgi:hypothetical protein
VLLFLSYATEDSEIAGEIADRLSSKDVSVYASQHAAGSPVLARAEPERAIQQADAFLALLSPDSLTSSSCRRERELALHREQLGRQESGSASGFVQVLQVRQTPYHRAGSLHSRPWLDLTGEAVRELVLDDLARRFKPLLGPPPRDLPPSGGGQRRRSPPNFRNRERELEEIRASLSNPDAEHFWLVIAPPQLGKTWLLERISGVYEPLAASWVVRFVDVGDLAPAVVGDPDAIVAMMFGYQPDPSSDLTLAQQIAASISRTRKRHLCLLDSAEQLGDGTVRMLRQHLGEITRLLGQAPYRDVGVAVIAASRREDGWKGISAARFEFRRLTQFRLEVIQQALQDMAGRRRDSTAELRDLAQRVHKLSEGLPAVLARCLAWIQEREWQGLDRMEDRETFDRIALPYIDEDLFSDDSFRGCGDLPTAPEQAVIRQAFLVTSPYRFLTVSHLSHHFKDGGLHEAINSLGWSVEDLWAAVSGTDLLHRPLPEPWLVVSPPIRRLLCRHAYPDDVSRSEAHRKACDFMQSYMIGQSGSDQCRVFVECLWHKAQALILGRSTEVSSEMLAFARGLRAFLNPNPAFDMAALHDHLMRRLDSDDEFETALAPVPGLFALLLEAVGQPT